MFIGDLNLFTSKRRRFRALIFQTVFAATAATMSRELWGAYEIQSLLVYSVMISAIIYPISGHWIWGGGWLSQLGFHAFAGSTTVHMVGGVAALVGAKMLGPRIGKYSKGRQKPMPSPAQPDPRRFWAYLYSGSAVWIQRRFNRIYDWAELPSRRQDYCDHQPRGCFRDLATMIVTWIRYKTRRFHDLNGALAGLVAITADATRVFLGVRRYRRICRYRSCFCS
jgi:Amt family ammonium transporter